MSWSSATSHDRADSGTSGKPPTASVGPDGYPKRLWDKRTGTIDKTVAAAWKSHDSRHILESGWTTLGPKVAHKLHVYMATWIRITE